MPDGTVRESLAIATSRFKPWPAFFPSLHISLHIYIRKHSFSFKNDVIQAISYTMLASMTQECIAVQPREKFLCKMVPKSYLHGKILSFWKRQ